MANNQSLSYDSDGGVAAGIIMITAAALGTTVNIAVMILILKTPSFHNAFGYISFSNLAASSVGLLAGILWTGPLTLFNADESYTETFIGARFGQLTHIAWYESMYCHLQIAITRLIAVVWPFAYSKLFSQNKLICFVASTWILSFLRTIMHFWYDCWVWFDVKTLTYQHRNTQCTYVMNIVNQFDTMTVGSLIISINVMTFWCLRKRIKKLRTGSGSFKEQQMSKLKSNIPYYMQGCVSALMMMTATISFYLLPAITTTKLQLAIVNTINWELILTSNGIILIIFNRSFRRLFHSQMLFAKTETNR